MSDQSERMPESHQAAHERLKGADKLLGHRVDSLAQDVVDLADAHAKCNDRIDAIEKWQWLCYGIAIGVTALAVYALKGLGLTP